MPAVTTPRTPEGRLLRRVRKAARLSIPDAAKAAGISPEHWGNIERGTRTIDGRHENVTGTPVTLAQMARALGIAAADLAAAERPDAASELDPAAGYTAGTPHGTPHGGGSREGISEEQLFTALITASPEDRDVFSRILRLEDRDMLTRILRLEDGEHGPMPWPERRRLIMAWLQGQPPEDATAAAC